MDEQRLLDIRTRVDAATQNIWAASKYTGDDVFTIDEASEDTDEVHFIAHVKTAEDTELILHAPNDLRWLLEENQRLSIDIERRKERAAKWRKACLNENKIASELHETLQVLVDKVHQSRAFVLPPELFVHLDKLKNNLHEGKEFMEGLSGMEDFMDLLSNPSSPVDSDTKEG